MPYNGRMADEAAVATFESVSFALLDSIEAKGATPPLLKALIAADNLDAEALGTLMASLLPVTARAAMCSPRQVLEQLFREAPSDEEWVEILAQL